MHLHLSKLLFVLGAPGQRLRDAATHKGLADAAHALERLHVDEGLHAALPGQLLGAGIVAVAEQVIREQAVEAAAAPGLVLDVLGRGDGVELVEVDDAGGGLGVQALLLAGVGGQLALHAAHAREHGVEVAQRVLLRGPARGGARGGVFEERLERRRVLFDGEVRGAEVFAEELVGKSEKRLVLTPKRNCIVSETKWWLWKAGGAVLGAEHEEEGRRRASVRGGGARHA